MQFEIARAEQFYREAIELERYLIADGKAVFGTMVTIYRELLAEIKRLDGDVFTRRVSLSSWRKLGIAARWFLPTPAWAKPKALLGAGLERGVAASPRPWPSSAADWPGWRPRSHWPSAVCTSNCSKPDGNWPACAREFPRSGHRRTRRSLPARQYGLLHEPGRLLPPHRHRRLLPPRRIGCTSLRPTVGAMTWPPVRWLPAPLHLAPSFLRLGYLTLGSALGSLERCGDWLACMPG